eukprot:tig00000792_g4182.t1
MLRYRRGGFQRFLRVRWYSDLLKKGARLLLNENGQLQLRFFCLDPTCTFLSWVCSAPLYLADVVDIIVRSGESSSLEGSLNDASEAGWETRTMTVVTADQRDTTIVAPTWRDFEIWYQGLMFLTTVGMRASSDDGISERASPVNGEDTLIEGADPHVIAPMDPALRGAPTWPPRLPFEDSAEGRPDSRGGRPMTAGGGDDFYRGHASAGRSRAAAPQVPPQRAQQQQQHAAAARALAQQQQQAAAAEAARQRRRRRSPLQELYEEEEEEEEQFELEDDLDVEDLVDDGYEDEGPGGHEWRAGPTRRPQAAPPARAGAAHAAAGYPRRAPGDPATAGRPHWQDAWDDEAAALERELVHQLEVQVVQQQKLIRRLAQKIDYLSAMKDQKDRIIRQLLSASYGKGAPRASWTAGSSRESDANFQQRQLLRGRAHNKALHKILATKEETIVQLLSIISHFLTAG